MVTGSWPSGGTGGGSSEVSLTLGLVWWWGRGGYSGVLAVQRGVGEGGSATAVPAAPGGKFRATADQSRSRLEGPDRLTLVMPVGNGWQRGPHAFHEVTDHSRYFRTGLRVGDFGQPRGQPIHVHDFL